jgi:prevent-host-death family protein
MAHGASSKTTTRELRANLRETLAQAAKGKEIVITLRGKPYVRIAPVAGDDAPSRYPLRGSVRFIADDFDAPAPLATDVPAKKTAKPKRRKKVS